MLPGEAVAANRWPRYDMARFNDHSRVRTGVSPMVLRLWACLVAAIVALVAAPLQARPLNIVAIGASNTSGLGVGGQTAYPAGPERLLRPRGIDAHRTNP